MNISLAVWISESRTKQASATDIGLFRYRCISARRSACSSCTDRPMRITPRSNNAKSGSAGLPSRLSRNAASVRTGSQVSSGRTQSFPLFDNPLMMGQSRSEEAHKRASIEQNRSFGHCPKPCMYFGFSAKSSGSPLATPARSQARSKQARSKQEALRDECRLLNACSRLSRTSRDLVTRLVLASFSNWSSRLSGNFREIVRTALAYYMVFRCAIPARTPSKWRPARWRTENDLLLYCLLQ